MHRVPPRRAAAALAAAAVPLLLLPVLLAPSASAHDELLSVTPAKDAVLTTAPTEVVLVFGEEVEQLGATVVATAGDGTSLTDGTAVVTGPKVTQALLPITTATTVTVKYRIVSSDGHPVSGSWSFEVDLPASLPASASPTSASASPPSPSSSAPAVEATDTPAAPTSDGTSSGSTGLWAVLGLGAVALVVAAVVLARRARRG